MRKINLFLLAAIISLGLLSCQGDKNSKKETVTDGTQALDKQWAKTFIDSVNAKFSEQIRSGDSVALASHYWPDAELMLDNSDAARGNEILTVWGAGIRMGIKDMNFTTTDINGSANWLIETGKYEMKGDKGVLMDHGKYVVIWERRGNEWKLYRDIGCTSMPPAR